MTTAKFILLLVLVLTISSQVHVLAFLGGIGKGLRSGRKGLGEGVGFGLPPPAGRKGLGEGVGFGLPPPESCFVSDQICQQYGFKYCCPAPSKKPCTNYLNGVGC